MDKLINQFLEYLEVEKGLSRATIDKQRELLIIILTNHY